MDEEDRRDDQADRGQDDKVDDVDVEPFDLAALRLSSLASPAFTAEGDGTLVSGDFSLTTDGKSVEASQDVDVQSVAKAGEDEDMDEAGGSLHGDGWYEVSHSGLLNEADRKIESSEQAHGDLAGESEVHVPSRNAGIVMSESPVARLPLQHTRDDTSDELGEKRGDSESDDDKTVECASPRDPVELDEAPDQPLKRDADKRPTGFCLSPSLAAVHLFPALSQTAPAPTYSLNALFPVVYDEPDDPPSLVKSSQPTTHRRKLVNGAQGNSAAKQLVKKAAPTSAPLPKPVAQSKRGNSTVSSQQQQVESLRQQLDGVTKSLSLQIRVADNDRKQLAQRNARLKAQLATLTSDLVRTKAENTKLKTENELYAAKMPKLQAELSDETTQADEKHAQTIQSQLEITQLRAKLQVLQTRTENLDGQVGGLQAELRAARKELRRRGILQQQNDEKVKRLETELHDAKVSYAQELQSAKQKVTVISQRQDRERVKRENELKKLYSQQLEEVKSALAKTAKRRKELEQVSATSELDVAALKTRVEDQDEENRKLHREIKSLDNRLVRSENTEVALRSQVGGLKIQLHAAERDRKKGPRMSTTTTKTSRLRSPLFPQPSVPGPESPLQTREVDLRRSLCSCCEAILESLDKADRLDESTDTNIVTTETVPESCPRCLALESELASAHQELLRVRNLHANELKVQATALERVLALRCA